MDDYILFRIENKDHVCRVHRVHGNKIDIVPVWPCKGIITIPVDLAKRIDDPITRRQFGMDNKLALCTDSQTGRLTFIPIVNGDDPPPSGFQGGTKGGLPQADSPPPAIAGGDKGGVSL